MGTRINETDEIDEIDETHEAGEQYSDFARVYDTFMDEVPYDKWLEYITNVLKQHGIMDGLVLDLGCGTGHLTGMLAEAGYDMIGVDGSEQMLEEASSRAREDGLDILYLHQDFTSFELYGTVRGVVSTCDALNYLLETEELQKTFSLVHNYLDDDGCFIFDFHPHHYYQTMGFTTYAYNCDEASYIWENEYDPEDEINEFDLTFFIRTESGLYEKQTEIHYQRAYSLDTMKELLEGAGFEIKTTVDGDTWKDVTPESDRIFITATKRL